MERRADARRDPASPGPTERVRFALRGTDLRPAGCPGTVVDEDRRPHGSYRPGADRPEWAARVAVRGLPACAGSPGCAGHPGCVRSPWSAGHPGCAGHPGSAGSSGSSPCGGSAERRLPAACRIRAAAGAPDTESAAPQRDAQLWATAARGRTASRDTAGASGRGTTPGWVPECRRAARSPRRRAAGPQWAFGRPATTRCGLIAASVRCCESRCRGEFEATRQ